MNSIYDAIEVGKIEKIDFSQINKFRILASDEIPKPDIVLQFKDKTVATRKNIFGVTGKAKVGKTFLMTLLNESVLMKGEFQNTLKSYLPNGKDKILYIDTEQSRYHVNLVMKRIYDVVGTHKIENLLMYNFDAVPTQKRHDYTKFLIYNTPGIGLVIIDGISDLVKTINDEIIAADMADDLRTWATECDVAIGYVLHQNPSDNAKMRGHLGTVLMNKSESVIQITSFKDNDSVKLVETTQTRNAKPENWSFEILDGIPVIQNECYQEPSAGRPKLKQLSDNEKLGLLSDVFIKDINNNGFSYSVLTERIKEAHIAKFGEIGIVKIKDLITYCKDMNWICQDAPKGNYKQQPYN